MKQKYQYVVMAAIAVFIFLTVILPLWRPQKPLKAQRNSIAPVAAPPAPSGESIAPSIEDLKGRLGVGTDSYKKEPATLAQVYARYPAEDAGGNMVAAWARVKPEEKTKAIEGLDRQIAKTKEALEIDPADKKAKHILFIYETLKKMYKSDFDFNLLETVPQDRGGLKPRS